MPYCSQISRQEGSQQVPVTPVHTDPVGMAAAENSPPLQCASPSQKEQEQTHVNLITFGPGTLTGWDSDIDGKDDAQEEEDAIAEIMTEGMNWEIQGWHTKRRNMTVQILTDSFLGNWSHRENKCALIIHPFPNINQWIRAIRRQEIPLQLPITVVALQCLKSMECLEPLKNNLAALCRAIRSCVQGRIFITSNIPNPRCVPVLGQRAIQHNRLLHQAVVGINKNIYSVFYCDLAAHLISEGKHLEPIATHFTPEGELTKVGCFVYRGCLLREKGVVPFSLDG